MQKKTKQASAVKPKKAAKPTNPKRGTSPRPSRAKPKFDPIEDIIADIRRGRIVIVTDDEDRENEGDLICAAEKITAAKVNFMATHGRGLICAPITQKRAAQLGLSRMVLDNRESFKTDFTVSVDAAHGVTTGISASDRAKTIKLLVSRETTPDDLVEPGHIFPLQAKSGGVLQRAGHTEAAVDLARLAGLDASAVICEILKPNGEMARLPELLAFKKEHGLKIGTIRDLIEYRSQREKLVVREETREIMTEHGPFEMRMYRSMQDNQRHYVLVRGDLDLASKRGAVLVRVHSENPASDIFEARQGGGNAIYDSLERIASEGTGALVYMRHSMAALAADPGRPRPAGSGDLPMDLREYGLGAQILSDLGLKQIKLLTNHPRRIIGLDGYGIEVVDSLPLKPKRQAKTKPEGRRTGN